jgi:tetratricopeptide (TPR) repeat protein
VLAHVDLGTALEHKGEVDAAITEYHIAVKGREKFPEAHYHLGHALEAKGDIDGAVPEYRTAVRQRPNYPLAQSAIAEASKPRTRIRSNIICD